MIEVGRFAAAIRVPGVLAVPAAAALPWRLATTLGRLPGPARRRLTGLLCAWRRELASTALVVAAGAETGSRQHE